jgi:hypothetical protein
LPATESWRELVVAGAQAQAALSSFWATVATNRSLFVSVYPEKGYDRPMSPQNRILTEILAPVRLTAMTDAGAGRNLPVRELEGQVPGLSHLALFDLFPIWGTAKTPIPLTRNRDLASLPARKSN